jgi:hypothetical protein
MQRCRAPCGHLILAFNDANAGLISSRCAWRMRGARAPGWAILIPVAFRRAGCQQSRDARIPELLSDRE